MKALIYHGPGDMSWSEARKPRVLQPGDAIVQVDTTTICGTDLHILKGDVPAVRPGRILGHEGVGTVVEVGPGVHDMTVGDRVLISCIKSCGHCPNCRAGLYSHCLGEEGQSGIGWILGHLINGTQAEYVRIPYADNSLYKLPDSVSNIEAVMLSDILPTGFEIGVLAGEVKPGDVVAVIGAGPVGLAAIATAGLCGAGTVVAIDRDTNRLDQAKGFGATDVVDPTHLDWQSKVLALTDGAGVDVAIEAVGLPETFTMAVELARPGGRIANIGVHGASVELALQDLWIRNIGITMGLVNTNTTAMLLKLVAQQKIPVAKFATHFFTLDQMIHAYDTFARASETKALKVIINRDPALA